MRMNDNPYLRFDFHPGKETPKIFTQPIYIISTSQMDEFSNCFAEAEIALKNGYYIAGYVSYEATYALNKLKIEINQPSMPLVWFGVFKEPSKIMSYEKQDYHIGHWKLNETEQTYIETFEKIKHQMQVQEIEQINYTVPFFADFYGDAYTFYEQLKLNQKASYSAFLQIDHHRILSISPELFFKLNDQNITVKPMKGTIHRGKSYKEDMLLKQWLESSAKNKLENAMITRLMKEELSSIVENSSVKIIDQYKIETYPTVYQMTSTIRGKIKDDLSVIDIFKALFPCGSITGIPKLKALECIAHFEKNNREVYCGAIGYITPNKQAVFNVPIRTVVIDELKKSATFGAGGAITAQSTAKEEYKEILTKAKVLQTNMESFQLLETFGLSNGEFIVFEEHMDRLRQSAAYFQFQIDLSIVRENLLALTDTYHEGDWRIRLLVHEHGQYEIDVHELTKPTLYDVKLAESPIDKNNIFMYHKTTHRKIYEQHLANAKGVFDVLLWNEQGEITEFTIGNIVVELDGHLYTPPIACGLLGGTFRARLLKEGKISERKIYKEELHDCSNIYLINSVRKWVSVHLITDK